MPVLPALFLLLSGSARASNAVNLVPHLVVSPARAPLLLPCCCFRLIKGIEIRMSPEFFHLDVLSGVLWFKIKASLWVLRFIIKASRFKLKVRLCENQGKFMGAVAQDQGKVVCR